MATQPFLPFDDEPAPAPAPQGSRLIRELARVCAEQPLAEKVLVAPSLPIGHQLLERLAREGHPWMNLRVETIRTLAHGLVGADLAREGLRLLSRAQALALVEQACGEALGEKAYFGPLRDRPGFHRAVHRTFDELRAAGISPAALPEGAFADKRKRRELKAILSRYDAALTAGGFVDAAEVLRRAVDAAAGAAAGEVLYLLPEGQELTAVERSLLERIAGSRLAALPTDPPAEWARNARAAKLLRATGEENEIREAFRRILASGSPFDDVEILHTDASTYPALCWELSREHDVPCTFSGGVAAPFTRPGQAALAFLDWIGQGFAADVLREALASGALTFERMPGHAEGAPGTRAAARSFRDARIGWGARRHRACLDRLAAELEKSDEPSAREDAGPEELAARDERRARRLAAARRARDFATRALELATEATREQCDLRPLARGCRTFVSEFARVGDELDGMALAALEKLLAELEVLSASTLSPAEAAQRLADAVRALSVAADRPRPGRIHVADYRSGGFSGRGQTYLLGLDEARHPGDDLEDPVLLDDERRAINRILAPAALALHRDRPRDAALALRGCVSRLTGALTASYSSWKLRSLDQQSEQFPSPFFLDLYRASSGSADADYSALLAALPVPAGFAPGVDLALDDTEWWLSRLRDAGLAAAAGAAAPIVRAFHPHLADGHRAETARDSDAFTIWDGFVESGTPELDPRTSGQPQSASRMETLAQCPFRYFLKHVLRVEAPEEVERDTTRWLDPMKAGSLLHEVFRLFFEQITASGEKPDAARHGSRIEELAEAAIDGLAGKDSARERARLRGAAPGDPPRQPHLPAPRGRALPVGRAALLRGGVRTAPRRVPFLDRQPRARRDPGRRRGVVSPARLDRPGGRSARRHLRRLGLQDRQRVPLQGRARHPRRAPDPARALRHGPRAAARPRRLARGRLALGLLLPGPEGRGPAAADRPRSLAHARRHAPPARPAARGGLSARGGQGGLQVLRLRIRLRRREDFPPSRAGEARRHATARAPGFPRDP